jgi:hypothetical protein
MVHPAVSRLRDGQLYGAAVVVEGLGSLSLLQDVSGSPVCEVPLRAGAAMPALSELWVASLSSDDDEDDEVLASTKGVVAGSLLDTVDVRHDEKVLAEPYDSLFVAAADLGDEDGRCRWVGVAATAVSHCLCIRRKVLSVVSPSSIGLEEGAFGASSVATRSGHVVGPTDASTVVVLVIGSISIMHAFLQLVLAFQELALVLLVSGTALCPLSSVVPHRLKVGPM